MHKKTRRGIQSVEIAFRILTVLQMAERAMALEDICVAGGINSERCQQLFGQSGEDRPRGGRREAVLLSLGSCRTFIGIRAIQQIDGFEIVRREVTFLRDTTKRSAAVTTWSNDGPISLFKQDGNQRGAFEFRTGLIPTLTSAAGRIYAAHLPANLTAHLISQEWDTVFDGKVDIGRFLGRRRA